MSQNTEGETFPLPKVAEALAPYIRARQEALRIRRILTIFLYQNIEGSHVKFPSPRSLAVPGVDVRVKQIPLEFTGVRKKYLHALKAHIKAREAYNLRLREPDEASLKATLQEQRAIETDASVAVATRLELLQEQHRYQKLRILQDYLDLLAKKDAAKPFQLSLDYILKDIPQVSELHPGVALESKSNDDTQALIYRLQKAVLRAQDSFETEKSLLEKLKSDSKGSKDENSENFNAKLIALSRTRNELIDWIEQQLARGAQIEDEESRVQSSHDEKSPLDIAQRKNQVQERYEDYLRARRSLVAFVSNMSNLAEGTPSSTQENSSPQKIEEHRTTHQEADIVLPYLTEYLIPAADAHKAYLQQESHLANTLKSETQETTKVLERLADESHLLLNFPSQVAQHRFQHEAASFKSNKFSLIFNEKLEGQEVQTIQQARAWDFATSAASAARQAAIEKRLDHGEKNLNNAHGLLKELQEIIGTDNEDEGVEVNPRSSTRKVGFKPQEESSKKGDRWNQIGIWNGLDGNISIEKTKYRDLP